MVTLDEHNKAVVEKFSREMSPYAGVTCPKCQIWTEMYFEGGIQMEDRPPSRPVKCPRCGFRGTMYVLVEPRREHEAPKT